MYAWQLGVEDSASSVLGNIIKRFETVSSSADNVRTKIEGVGDTLKDVKPPEFNTKNVASAITSASNAISYYKDIIDELPQKWDNVRSSIVDTVVAFKQGNWDSIRESIGSVLADATVYLGEFTRGWQILTTNFDGTSNLIGRGMDFIGNKLLGATKYVYSMGAAFVTDTLPSLLTFVGRGVVSLAGFVASLTGATGAQAALNAVMLANPIGLIVAGIAAVGLAVYGLYTYWEDIKGYLVSFGKFFFENSPFGWIYNIINNLFPNFKNAVVDTFKSIFGWIDTYFIQPISNAISWIGEQFGNISKDANSAINSSNAAIVSNSATYAELMGKNNSPLVFMPGTSDNTASGVGSSVQSASKKRSGDVSRIGKAQSIDGGGGQIKNINIRIDKLVETVQNNFQSGGQMDERKIREAVTRALVDGVNDFNRQ